MHANRWIQLWSIAASAVVLGACGRPGAAPAGPAPAVADPQAEWQRVLQAARQEGTINILSGSSTSHEIPHFEKAFADLTGGHVEFTELTAATIVSRLPEEYAAHQYNWDIILLGGSSGISEELDKAGVLGDLNQYFIMPDLTQDSTWVGGFGDIWVDQDTRKYKIHHQATLSLGSAWWVNRDVLPESRLNKIEDVFTIPELKGKFCTYDPRVEGAADANFGQIAGMYGSAMLRRLFTELDIVVTRDFTKLTQDTLRGACLISVGARIPDLHAQGVGLNIQEWDVFNPGIAPEYADRLKPTCCGAGKTKSTIDGWFGGGSANGMLSVANNPPHPNAAKVFVNWLLSKEGQMAWPDPDQDSTCSRRADLQDWCAKEYRQMGAQAALWAPIEEGKTYISIHTRQNFWLRKVAQDTGLEVFGR
ncbi:MAG TPA: hypothetical protein VFC51_09375 [Chloroflexota bacterium]|nr:hypothetical protein [Chloroflexota bacterium]